MKNWTMLLPAAALTLGLAACGGGSEESTAKTPAGSSSTPTAADGGLDKTSGCQEAIKLQGDLGAPAGAEAAYKEAAGAYAELAGKVEDAELKKLLTAVETSLNDGATALASGKQADVAAGAKAFGELMKYCTGA